MTDRRHLIGAMIILAAAVALYCATSALPALSGLPEPGKQTDFFWHPPSRRLVGIAHPAEGEPLPASASEHFLPDDHPLLQGLRGPISLLYAQRWLLRPGRQQWSFFLRQEESSAAVASPGAALAALGDDYRVSWLIAGDYRTADGQVISFRPDQIPPGPAARAHQLLEEVQASRPAGAPGPADDLLSPDAAAAHPHTGWILADGLLEEDPVVIAVTYPEENPRVGVFTGRGSFEEGVRAIQNFLDHHGISWGEIDESIPETADLLEEYDLLWFPGGFSEQYRYYVQSHDRIRDFVSSGGGFIGICAGAYYASDTMRWRGGDPADYPLNLFAGEAAGPIGPPASWGNPTPLVLAGDHPANRGANPVLDVYYLDGPQFSGGGEQSFEVLARYQVNDGPAAITFTYGSGTVLLLGPHPELGFDAEAGTFDLDGGNGAQWPWLHSVFSALFTR
ncbi:MAG: BPL-N domain-containing protein [Bacillota bacterium]